MTVRQLTPDTVFPDGMTLKNVQDAVSAAAAIGLWYVAHEMAFRYKLQDVICMKCGKITKPQDYTYVSHGGLAIRKCLGCNRGTNR